MQIAGIMQLEHEDSKQRQKPWDTDINGKAGISPQGPCWQGIFEGKDSRNAGSSQAGLSQLHGKCSHHKHRTCWERSGRAA